MSTPAPVRALPGEPGDASLVFACAPTNDLWRALEAAGVGASRHADAAAAVRAAPSGGAVLLLADGYPAAPTLLTPDLMAEASRRRLRLFVEFPGWLPDLETGSARTTQYERAVVGSDAFGPGLARLRIVGINDCHYVPVAAAAADLVLARVAGFDTAVFGLPDSGVQPLLFVHPTRADLMVAATKLSNFVTARYTPADAWGLIWRYILGWLQRGRARVQPAWTPAVRPSFAPEAVLPATVERAAFRRGVAWIHRAKLLIHPSWQHLVEGAVAYPDQVAPAPAAELPEGDGSLGLLEGFNARIRHDGTQAMRWWLRNDCINECAMACAFSGVLDGAAADRTVAANLHDFVYLNSPLAQGSRADPASASFGLLGWNTTAKYYEDMDGFGVYYGDDNARALLGTMASAALLQTDRWDEPLLRCLLANLRTTGRLGFRGNRLDEKPLQEHGWRHYRDSEVVNFAPHYEAYLWACFLWAYARTGYEPFLTSAAAGIRATMAAYPAQWHWTNGIQQERARMLLPLAWLVRVRDTAEHRGWLRFMAAELIAAQDACGAIREELGDPAMGDFGPPKTNADYGLHEATLIQANGDPLSDLLYTTNFAFLGLHEAAAATGDADIRAAADQLAQFLCRIQVRSEQRPELDGAWFRAFDYRRWDYWGSNADAGWGAWSIESGWTQAWIISVLALRQMNTSLWDLTANSRIAVHQDRLLKLMELV